MNIKIAAHFSLSSIQQLNPLMNWKHFFFNLNSFVCLSRMKDDSSSSGRRGLHLSPFRLHQSAATLTAVHNLRQFPSDQINTFNFLLIKHNEMVRILQSSSNIDDDYIQNDEIGGS